MCVCARVRVCACLSHSLNINWCISAAAEKTIKASGAGDDAIVAATNTCVPGLRTHTHTRTDTDTDAYMSFNTPIQALTADVEILHAFTHFLCTHRMRA